MARTRHWVRTSRGTRGSGDFPYASGTATVPLATINASYDSATLLRSIVTVRIGVVPHADLSPLPYNWTAACKAAFYVSYQDHADTSWIAPTVASDFRIVGVQDLQSEYIPAITSAPLGAGSWQTPDPLDTKGMRRPPVAASNASVRIGLWWASMDMVGEGAGSGVEWSIWWTAQLLFESAPGT